ncbi:hypothetical protein TNCV_4637191 [Trichonephila clavipes]|nr:hypothetical protein TNCV_4637191 [Trichonephila clavipes]
MPCPLRILTGRNQKGLNQEFWVPIGYVICCSPRLGQSIGEEDAYRATRGLLAVILNNGQVTGTTPELAPPSPNYHTTPT